MYALLGTLAGGSIYAFVIWLRSPTRSHGMALMAINGLGLYTHYAYPVMMAIEGAVLLLRLVAIPKRTQALKLLAGWIAINVTSLAFYVPWMPTAWRQTTTWPKTGLPYELPDALFRVWSWLLGWKLTGEAPWVPVVSAALLAAALLPLSRPGMRRVWAVATAPIWGLAPVAAIFALNLYRESFLKFLIVAQPAFAIWAGAGIGRIARFRPKALSGMITLAALGALIWGDVVCLGAMYGDPAYFRADYRGIARMIEADARPGDAVITDAANQWEVFTYYHQEGAPVYPLPRYRPINEEATRAELADILQRHDRVYTLYWGELEADPNRVIERYLLTNAFEVSSTWHGDVRLVTYVSPAPAPSAPDVESGALFGDSIRLIGYWINARQVAPGGYLAVTLFWEAMGPLDTRYKVFLHLLGPNGQLAAQRDSEPVGGMAPTSTWTPGEVVADNHGLIIPNDASPGRYTLVLGMYPIYDPSARLQVTADGEPTGDTLPLAEITVAPAR